MTIPAHVDAALVRSFDYHSDPAFLADPYAGLDQVRRDRVFFSESQGGYWVLTTIEDIRAALQRPEVFSSREFAIPTGVYPRTMRPLALDPPEHGRYRQPLAPLFAPAAVATREAEMRRVAVGLIESFVADHAADLVEALARPFPTTVFVSMLGLPPDEAATFERWNHDLLHAYGEPEIRAAAAGSILTYLGQVVAERMASAAPSGDLFDVLLAARIDDRPLTHDEVLDYAFMLFIAGLDTVTAVLGFSLKCLASQPQLQKELRADPSVIPAAVEELLRAHSIVNTARVVTTDTPFAGVQLRAGDRVLLATALASRDPAEFDDPAEVRFDREVNRHLAFGAGPHRCLGSHLARLEMRVVIEELVGRLPVFAIAEDAPIVIHGGGVFGIDRLPVRW
jgi:cytochrome P450